MLLSLPFLWAGRLAGMFGSPLCVALLKTAWRISLDGRTGVTALGAIAKYVGPAEAIGCGLAWMEKHPRAELAAYAGIVAAEAGLADIARNMLTASSQFPPDGMGLAETLEFSVAKRFEPLGAAADCARRLESRNDLSPTVSGMIYTELLWDAVLRGRLDEARGRAEHILAIGDAPMANLVLAALSHNAGQSAGHMAKASKLPPAELHYYSFLTASGTGDDERANEHLARLTEFNTGLAEYAAVQVSAAREAE